jgi:hypothetical protein
MRTLGEAKLAINNLYIRISRKSVKSNDSEEQGSTQHINKSNEGPQETTSLQHSEQTMTEKLHAIQDRLLDLQLVVHKVEQLSRDKK